jgi:hypothetical protein
VLGLLVVSSSYFRMLLNEVMKFLSSFFGLFDMSFVNFDSFLDSSNDALTSSFGNSVLENFLKGLVSLFRMVMSKFVMLHEDLMGSRNSHGVSFTDFVHFLSLLTEVGGGSSQFVSNSPLFVSIDGMVDSSAAVFVGDFKMMVSGLALEMLLKVLAKHALH